MNILEHHYTWTHYTWGWQFCRCRGLGTPGSRTEREWFLELSCRIFWQNIGYSLVSHPVVTVLLFQKPKMICAETGWHMCPLVHVSGISKGITWFTYGDGTRQVLHTSMRTRVLLWRWASCEVHVIHPWGGRDYNGLFPYDMFMLQKSPEESQTLIM